MIALNNEERKKQLSRVELYDTPEHKREQARRLKDKPLKIKLKGVLDQEAKSAPTPGSRAAVRQEQTATPTRVEKTASYDAPRPTTAQPSQPTPPVYTASTASQPQRHHASRPAGGHKKHRIYKTILGVAIAALVVFFVVFLIKQQNPVNTTSDETVSSSETSSHKSSSSHKKRSHSTLSTATDVQDSYQTAPTTTSQATSTTTDDQTTTNSNDNQSTYQSKPSQPQDTTSNGNGNGTGNGNTGTTTGSAQSEATPSGGTRAPAEQ
ncbi:hypothetical protein IV41_GL000044 [Limosilactobacillus ingluviei]|uniref:Uncharacterized protein n=1 Tax=Limosilactobacillus ingluviei TaxID=148604 RepID=A0A0R2GXR7_9LACO|nr:hypothetical protein IV41_GL000044 [Limosilactobacillus ingluviei]